MAILDIQIDEELHEFLRAQAFAKGFATAEAYAESVLRDQLRGHEILEELMIAGQTSGEPIEATPEYWAGKHRRLAEQVRKRRSS